MDNNIYIDDMLNDIADYKGMSTLMLKMEYMELYSAVNNLYLLENNYKTPSKKDITEIEDKCVESLFDKYV